MKLFFDKVLGWYSRLSIFKKAQFQAVFLVALAVVVLIALYVPAWLRIHQVPGVPKISNSLPAFSTPQTIAVSSGHNSSSKNSSASSASTRSQGTSNGSQKSAGAEVYASAEPAQTPVSQYLPGTTQATTPPTTSPSEPPVAPKTEPHQSGGLLNQIITPVTKLLPKVTISP